MTESIASRASITSIPIEPDTGRVRNNVTVERDINSYFRIQHAGRFLRSWNIFVLAAVLVLAFTIPLRLGFWIIYTPAYIHLYVTFVLFDAICDLVLVVDIVANFRVTYVRNGKLLGDSWRMASMYLKSWFVLDLIASVPFDWLLVWYISPLQTMMRLPRLLRTIKLLVFFDLWESYASSANTLKLVKMFLVFGLLVHWVSCSYFFIAQVQGFGVDTFVPGYQIQFYPLESQYIRATFWSVVTMTGFGDNGTFPHNNLEMVFQLCVLVVGVMLFAAIISNIGTLLRTLNKSREEFAEKISVINEFMTNRQLPSLLRQRIRSYYDYMWSKQKGIVDADVLDGLPANLRTEVELFINRSTLAKVPIFRNCSGGFLNAVVGYLEGQIYSPGDYIIFAGDLGNSMYFLSAGTVQVFSETGQLLAELGEGSFFGEIALLYETKRTASIRAKTFCDVNMLSRDKLDVLLEEFPGHRYLIEQEAESRLSRNEVLRCLRMHPLFRGVEEHIYEKLSSYALPQTFQNKKLLETTNYSQYLLLSGEMRVLDCEKQVIASVKGPVWVLEPPASISSETPLNASASPAGLTPQANALIRLNNGQDFMQGPMRKRSISMASNADPDPTKLLRSSLNSDSQLRTNSISSNHVTCHIRYLDISPGGVLCAIALKDIMNALEMFPAEREAFIAVLDGLDESSRPCMVEACETLGADRSGKSSAHLSERTPSMSGSTPPRMNGRRESSSYGSIGLTNHRSSNASGILGPAGNYSSSALGRMPSLMKKSGPTLLEKRKKSLSYIPTSYSIGEDFQSIGDSENINILAVLMEMSKAPRLDGKLSLEAYSHLELLQIQNQTMILLRDITEALCGTPRSSSESASLH